MLQRFFLLKERFFSLLGKRDTHHLTVQILSGNFSDKSQMVYIKNQISVTKHEIEAWKSQSGRKGKDIILVESIQTLDEKALVVNITCLHLRKQRLKVFSAHTHIESPRVSE